jgi:aspartate/methionine/tyrosine aminotransferase
MSAAVATVDVKLNHRVAGLQISKTMALTDLASSMREAGQDVISLAAGEPDFDTPQPVIDAGNHALQWAHW